MAMKWSDKIPEGGKKRKPAPSQYRVERQERSGPGFFGFLWSCVKMVLLGVLGLWAILMFMVFSESNIAALFGPIALMLGIWAVIIFALGLVVRVMWWGISAPFRRR